MEQWLPEIDNVRSTIWNKITGGGTIESNREEDTLVTLQILFDSFRIFVFFIIGVLGLRHLVLLRGEGTFFRMSFRGFFILVISRVMGSKFRR